MAPTRPSAPIRLYMPDTGWGVPFATNAPFPLKLQTWLRLADLPCEVVTENNSTKGPKGKTPWIEDGGVTMGDSELIIDYLGRRYGIDLDAHLDPAERALGLAWRRTFEEHYHQAFEHQLFLGRGGRARLDAFARGFPALMRRMLPIALTASLRRQLVARGIARHREHEVIAMGKADLDAFSVFLGDRPYALGDEPSTTDATAFGFLAVSIHVEGDNPLFRHAASLDNLAAYCERMRARYFPETLRA